MITKTQFLLYLDAPMHIWADKQGKAEPRLSQYDQHLMEQGRVVEELAREFLPTYIPAAGDDLEFEWQKTFVDGNFEVRVDALVFDKKAQVYDIYEIKSSTSIKNEHRYDLAFQRLVCEASIPVRSVYIVLVNKDYVRSGEVDIGQLFIVSELTEAVEVLREELSSAREEALQVTSLVTPQGIRKCTKPNDCPCPSLCHPHLPEHPIYDIPRLNRGKARELKSRGIVAIEDIPDDYPLSDRQGRHVLAVKRGEPLIDLAAIMAELAKLEYPLYFLDYESYNPAVPLYDGFKPYQHIVFQYSLHVIAAPGDEATHFECLITSEGEPGPTLLEQFAEHMGGSGSVVVWNKTFEMARNKEMAERYPEYGELLEGINERVFDLMECFSKGYYIHPDFHGSASIKSVLPVLVDDPDLNYEVMRISGGDEAMLAWAKIATESVADKEIETVSEALLRYCRLDTLAMVRNLEVLNALKGNENR